jgi:hypothetical protein
LLQAYRTPGRGFVEIFLSGETLGYPPVDFTGAEPPHGPKLQAPDNSLPRISLERLRVNAHDGRCFIGVEQRLRMEIG